MTWKKNKAMVAELVGKSYDFIIHEEFRWTNWAAPKKANGSFDHDNALTGDDLILFVNGHLFPYLQASLGGSMVWKRFTHFRTLFCPLPKNSNQKYCADPICEKARKQ